MKHRGAIYSVTAGHPKKIAKAVILSVLANFANLIPVGFLTTAVLTLYSYFGGQAVLDFHRLWMLWGIMIYQAFSGIELIYNDMHLEYCKKTQDSHAGVIEINYCREGRCECAFGEQSYCYMSADDLSLCSLQRKSHSSSFPTSHYHGITVIRL